MTPHCWLVLLLAASVDALHAQQVPVVRLAPPTASPTTEFTEIPDLAELPGGQLLTADSRDRELIMLDPVTSRTRVVARSGGGPMEFRAFQHLLPRSDGSVILADFPQRRFLPISTAGQPMDVIPFPVNPGMIAAIDSRGRVYASAFGPLRTDGSRPDSMFLLRWIPGAARADTVMYHKLTNASHGIRSGEKIDVFYPKDAIVVLPNADVMLLEAATYRVSIFRDGRLLHTSQIPWQQVPVTPADKRAHAFADAQSRKRAMAGGPRAGMQPPPGFVFGEYVYPRTFPAFDRYKAAHVTPDGHVWVARMTAAERPPTDYDVLSADGRLVAKVVVPANYIMLGFGRGTVYFGEKDADDVVRIRRHTNPI